MPDNENRHNIYKAEKIREYWLINMSTDLPELSPGQPMNHLHSCLMLTRQYGMALFPGWLSRCYHFDNIHLMLCRLRRTVVRLINRLQ